MIAEMHLYVAIIRQICILLVPLEAPQGIIPLSDIFLENTFYPNETPLTKDLFFSGHVASIWIYFLCTNNKILRFLFFIGTISMSFMVLSMRIHYTYDVVGAILATTGIYLLHSHFYEKRLSVYQIKCMRNQ
jgi:FtsH-binding integral membrane protein